MHQRSLRRLRLLPFLVLATLLVSSLTGCGESAEAKANRLAIGPLLQRHQGVSHDVVAWEKGPGASGHTWQNSFDAYDRYIADEQEIQKNLRNVVPADPGYACVVALMNRSVEAQTAMLQSLRNLTQQTFRIKVAVDRYADQQREYYAASSYIDHIYLRGMREAKNDVAEASTAAGEHRETAIAAARAVLALQDTLNLANAALTLLPTITPAEVFMPTPKGADTTARGLPLDAVTKRAPGRRSVASLCPIPPAGATTPKPAPSDSQAHAPHAGAVDPDTVAPPPVPPLPTARSGSAGATT